MAELTTPLRTACATGDLPQARSFYTELLAQHPLTENDILTQMAIVAAENKHPSILSFCFSKGLELDPEELIDPLIQAACCSGSIETIRVLLDNGMDVRFYLKMDVSPLVSACYTGDVALARFLLDAGADSNIGYPCGGYMALVWAIVGSNASLEMVELLLARGTVIKGTGALIAAAENGNIGAVKLLLEHGEKTGDLALEETEEWGGYDDRKLDDQGPALYKAAANGYLAIVELLLEKGADPTHGDRVGGYPADIAEKNGHEEIARKLRSLGTGRLQCVESSEFTKWNTFR